MDRIVLLVFLLFLQVSQVEAEVANLTVDNYFGKTKGKTVFIRFYAPWCGHSQKMKPDWDKLAHAFEGNHTGLVADIDCSGEGKPLCDKEGVSSFPTLKYGDPFSLETYDGSRSYEDMLIFAQKALKPICSVGNIDVCDDDKKKLIKYFENLPVEDIQRKIKEDEQKMKDSKKLFEGEVDKLQAKYQSLLEEKERKIAEVRSSDLKYLLAIEKAKTKEEGSRDEL